ncbi:hypothetical protein ACIHAR_17185 [Streptomyces sp. NPDC052016]|uniref:hypothetical protein n=1 Tax=unclassified Streptomyces TaxID=2593676 RepID=UPI0034247104
MFRGVTARTVVSILAAVLLALPFFAPTSSFARAHTARQAEAKAQPGIKPSGTSLRDETVTSRTCDRSGAPGDPFRTRDRNRAALTADSAPQERERAVPAPDPAATHPLGGPAALHHRSSRSSTSHSPAALQVFRC